MTSRLRIYSAENRGYKYIETTFYDDKLMGVMAAIITASPLVDRVELVMNRDEVVTLKGDGTLEKPKRKWFGFW